MKKSLIPNIRFAVAFSGGGDSTALVHMLRKQNPLVLIVDHGLREGSAQEALNAKAFAENLGLETRILTWEHNNPTTGLQEKARRARYGLMGQVCREEGIHDLFTGHTEDDQAETLLMRYDRGTDWRGAAGIAEQVYAPVWPELAKVTLVRPLLGVSRLALRHYNRTHKLRWAEDPSNSNNSFTRIRAREFLAEKPKVKSDLLKTAGKLKLGRGVENERLRLILKASQASRRVPWLQELFGVLVLRSEVPLQLLSCILQALGGGNRPIDRQKLENFKHEVWRRKTPGATLGGVYASRRKNGDIYFGADPSVFKGRHNKAALSDLYLEEGQSAVWDGRFLITAKRGDKIVRLAHKVLQSRELEPEHRFLQEMNRIPSVYRGGMPAVFDAHSGQLQASVGLHSHVNVSVEPLMAARLQAILST